MSANKILVVEDETAIREMVVFHLVRAGYETLQAGNCREAREILANERPDLALIDWMLPDMSGLELTRMIKRDPANEDLGIIMLTARTAESDMVTGLDGGADDYVTKPFAPRELIARIRSVLRRAKAGNADVVVAGVLSLDTTGHKLTANGETLKLGPTEYRLLQFLMTHPDRVFSRAQLLDRVWGANVYVEERTVDVHIRRLRQALGDADGYVQTVRGAGYRFSAIDVDAD